MTPLLLFLLCCAAVYVGTVQTAFTALMRLPLRLNAERRGAGEGLAYYLEEPLRLFLPARLLQALFVSSVTLLGLLLVQGPTAGRGAIVLGGVAVFIFGCGHLIPLLIARRDPERVLEVLLPSFRAATRIVQPVTLALVQLLVRARTERADESVGVTDDAGDDAEPTDAEHRSAEDESEEHKLLRSVVEFGDTLVREVMTPRPDIVAVQADATLAELRTLFADQQYSRLPVYKDSLDHILGFVFVKDLVELTDASPADRVIARLMRPAYVVPETKRVADLLREFQTKRAQSAIVHDEYGGTAGLVTVEDLLEELVGEIQDEYDVEVEPIVDEGDGSYLFSGTVGVDDLAERLHVEIERQGFETVGGYLLARLGRVPRVGETLDVDELHVEILEGERRRIQRVRMRRRPETIEAELP